MLNLSATFLSLGRSGALAQVLPSFKECGRGNYVVVAIECNAFGVRTPCDP